MATTFRRRGRRGSHEVDSFDRAGTDAQVEELFGIVIDRLARTTQAFVTGDRTAASRVVASEPEVDRLQLDVEALATHHLMDRYAVASDDDLRYLVAVLRIVPELERSADLVEHIALRTGAGTTEALTEQTREIFAAMGAQAVAMWRLALDAWKRGDGSAADSLRVDDDRLDDLHIRVTEALTNSRISTSAAIELGLVARFFERLGDHAVNVTRRLDFLRSSNPAGALL